MSTIDPKKIFYQMTPLLTDENEGDSMLDFDSGTACLTEKEAMQAADDYVNDSEMDAPDCIIYRCVPIKRVHRPRLIVEEIEDPTGQRRKRTPRPLPSRAGEAPAAESSPAAGAEPLMQTNASADVTPQSSEQSTNDADGPVIINSATTNCAATEIDLPGFLDRRAGSTT